MSGAAELLHPVNHLRVGSRALPRKVAISAYIYMVPSPPSSDLPFVVVLSTFCRGSAPKIPKFHKIKVFQNTTAYVTVSIPIFGILGIFWNFRNVWNWEIVCLALEFLEFSEFLDFLDFLECLELGDCVFNFGFFGMFGIGRLGV